MSPLLSTEKGYAHTVHGLCLLSDIHCPELCEAPEDCVPDVRIRIGKTPERLERFEREAARFAVAPGELLLRVDGVARFWVRDGREIVIEPAAGASEDEIRLFMYGTGLGAVMLQQGRLPIHASTVVRDGRALLIAGQSGAGKSTLAHALVRRGWSLLCDDVTVVEARPEGAVAYPGFPSIKLWRDVLEHVGTDLAGLSSIRREIEKYRWNANERFFEKETRVHAMLVLRPRQKPEIESEAILGANKFRCLVLQTFRKQLIQGMADECQLFSSWVPLLNALSMWFVYRPQIPLDPEKLADHVECIVT